MIWDIGKFILFILLVFLVPGSVLIKNSSNKYLLSTVFTSICVGLVAFTAASLLGGYLNFRHLNLLVTVLFFLFFIFTNKERLGTRVTPLVELIKKKHLCWLFAIILLGTVFQNNTTFRSGTIYDFGVGYWGPLARDGVWHEALTNELVAKFPPDNPGLSSERLVNYHYLYNLLVAETHKFSGISIPDLIYRLYPILFSILLGIGTYVLSIKLFKKRVVSLFAVFFAYFGSSFGWIVEYIRSGALGGESTFWANQPVSFNLNPPFAVSLVLLISLAYLFLQLKFKRKGIYLSFIMIGSLLIGFKVYAGLIFIGALAAISLEALIFKKRLLYLKLLIVILPLTFLIFALQSPFAGGLIEFRPFWFVDSMMDFGDRVGWLRISMARDAYFEEDRWIKYLSVESLSFAIFVIGNMGTRIIGLIPALGIWWKSLFKLNGFCLIFWMSLIAFALPLIFVQKGNPWNTIQFFYYFLYFSALFAGYSLYVISKKLPRNLGLICVVFILLVTPISSVGTFRSGFNPTPPASISGYEYEALKFLSNQKRGAVLTYPYKAGLREKFDEPFPLWAYSPSTYVSAVSGQPVFLEDIEQQTILQYDFKSRENQSVKFFTEADIAWSTRFLYGNAIEYVYIPEFFKLPKEEEAYPMIKIFENSEADLYRVVR